MRSRVTAPPPTVYHLSSWVARFPPMEGKGALCTSDFSRSRLVAPRSLTVNKGRCPCFSRCESHGSPRSAQWAQEQPE